MASPEAERFADLLRSAPKMVEMALPDQRAAGEHAEDMTGEADGVEYTAVDDQGVTGLWATPPGAVQGRHVLYLFGGGHVISSVASRRKFGGHLALATCASVLIADYPLAPEHPFPADIEATTAVYRWLLAGGRDPAHLALAGESSGGGLVLSTLLSLRAAADPLPAAAYLMSPWADLTCAGASFASQKELDLEATRDGLLRMAGQYLNGHDPTDPLASPALADLSRLPPLLVQVGGCEVLLDDSVAIVRRAGMAGTPATLEIWPEMQHFFQLGVGVYPEAKAALHGAGRWLVARL